MKRFILVATIPAIVAAGEAGAATMFPSSVFDAGVIPRDVVSGDFNHDGLADLAFVSQGQNGIGPAEVRAFLGNGDGSFRAAATINLGVDASLLLAGDLNGDGKTDLVVDMLSPNPDKILLSNGDGTFQAAPDVPGAPTARVALGDYNGDGKLDLLLVRGSTTPTFDVLRGVGDGTFLASTTGPISEPSVFGNLGGIGDVNGDGNLDLVIGAGSLGARSFLGNGDGTFNVVAAVSDGTAKVTRLVDMDRDGRLDLVIGWGGNGVGLSGPLAMYRGDGNGTFQQPASWSVNLNSGVDGLATGDINGDGWPDLVVTNFEEVDVWFGIGGGNVALHESFLGGDFPFRSVLGDFDGRGGADLAFVAWGSFTGYALLSDDDGSFGQHLSNPTALAIGPEPRVALQADFNGDGIADIAGVHCSAPNVCTQVGVALGLSGGGFGATALQDVGIFPKVAIAADFNGDGHPDLAVGNAEWGTEPALPGTISVLIGVGNGTLLPQTKYTVGYVPWAMAAADLDHDGDLDLVVVDKSTDGIGHAPDIYIFPGNGNGTFAAPRILPGGSTPRDVKIEDLNGDGRLDLAIAGGIYPGPAAELAIMLGNGDLTFGPRQVVGQGYSFMSVGASDLDGDGDIDLITVDNGTSSYDFTDLGSARVWFNNGGGTFTPSVPIRGGVGPTDGQLADLNGDGILDLWTSNYWSYDVSIFAGKGDGTFAPPERYATLGYENLLLGQFDGDSRSDLILAGYFETFAVLNISPATPQIRMGRVPGVVYWQGVPLAAGYDVVKGDLAALKTGGLTVSIIGCSQSGGLQQSFVDPTVPAVGNGFFYIVRAIKPTGDPATYDEEGSGQVAPRDAAIDASGLACP